MSKMAEGLKNRPRELFARDLKIMPFSELESAGDDVIDRVRSDIEAGDVYIAQGAADRSLLQRIRRYLVQVATHSLPNYHPIEAGAPNFHRMNRLDPRAYVRGSFHQFSFFPWNQDIFDLFTRLKPVYQVKNRISGLPADRFLGPTPDEGCTARLSFQFYPAGEGQLNAHSDPVDRHQLTVPLMMLGRKGEDFQEGGGFVVNADGEKVLTDEACDWGDVVFFNAQTVHGVDPVDPKEPLDWLSFRGRWTIVFAVNKLASTGDIPDAVDYGA